MEPETQHVWITTRRLKPGTREGSARPGVRDGLNMLSAHEYWAEDRDEVVGISVESPQAVTVPASEVETERRRAMAPYVVEEHSGFYDGRSS